MTRRPLLLVTSLALAAVGAGDPVDPAAITYQKDVRAIVESNCQSCHSPGGIAPFTQNGGDAEVKGVEVDFQAQLTDSLYLSGGVGYMGIAVAVVGRMHPAGVLGAALLFGTLSQGALVVNAMVPKELLDVLQAVIILAVAATPYLRRALEREATA